MKRTLRQLWQVVKTPFRLTAGALLTLLGLLGLLLPILPGWIFIFPGLALLLPGTRAGHWLREKTERVRAEVNRRRGKTDERSPEEVPPDEAAPDGPVE
ncbi:MAG: hypothetical protein R6X20_11760 [Phycisphaerae bacterium]